LAGDGILTAKNIAALATWVGEEKSSLILAAMQPEKMSEAQRGLNELTRDLHDSHKTFERALNRKPAKKRRSGTRAA
jgi:hypothetical protein